MKRTVIAAILISTAAQALAQTQTDDTGPCTDQQEVTSPDPATNPDGFGQLVGEHGETNANTETDDTVADGGDAHTGDPAYGDCDGR